MNSCWRQRSSHSIFLWCMTEGSLVCCYLFQAIAQLWVPKPDMMFSTALGPCLFVGYLEWVYSRSRVLFSLVGQSPYCTKPMTSEVRSTWLKSPDTVVKASWCWVYVLAAVSRIMSHTPSIESKQQWRRSVKNFLGTQNGLRPTAIVQYPNTSSLLLCLGLYHSLFASTGWKGRSRQELAMLLFSQVSVKHIRLYSWCKHL